MQPSRHPSRSAQRQPLLHESVIALRAPAQVWSEHDGSLGTSPIDGVYLGDNRVLSGLTLRIDGHVGEHLATTPLSASVVRFDALYRELDTVGGTDPGVRGRLTRSVESGCVAHRFELCSRRPLALATELRVELHADLTGMPTVKAGAASGAPLVTTTSGGAEWGDGSVTATLDAPGATIAVDGATITLSWPLTLSAPGSAVIDFTLTMTDASAVVFAAPGPAPWATPELSGVNDELERWVRRALDDLDALRMVSDRAPDDQFLAAGAPWFFTLFGRDSLWAARMLLPLGTELAASTLRALASVQGAASDVDTAERPGKIMHELRSTAMVFAEGGNGAPPVGVPTGPHAGPPAASHAGARTAEIAAERTVELPPLYYGTVDATPLWICLLVDAHRAGMPNAEVRALLPHLDAALAWMRDFGDSDGDGLLEYVDETGRGLSNQGWKDSGDSVQWRDGTLAEGPIALCEVQAYAYQAAIGGAELLDEFRAAGAGDEWRAWADRLQHAFRRSFWIADPAGAYPAIALDARKQPVDTVTSNMGHLLGTGLLHPDEAALVARRLVSPELASGFGLRTMSTDSAGYWPLSYHGGSVWTHDTAIAIAGLAAEGFPAEAAELSTGLLRAAVAFDYRMPELHSGDPLADGPVPAPYPAACRPQAWSAAAAITVLTTLR